VVKDLDIDLAAYPHGVLTLDKIRVYFGRSRFSLAFKTLQYSIRRVEFDNWLLKRCGAPVVRHAVREIERDGDSYVIDGEYRCRYLVGAGGTRCPVKRSLFPPEQGRLIVTLEVEYEARPKAPTCTLFYPYGGLAGYGWYVPKAGAVNIGYGGVASQYDGNFRWLWGAFMQTLRDRGLVSGYIPPPTGHPYFVGDRRKDVRRDNAFIVGDAAGLATVDMGEGIGPAVESGLAAAREIAGEGRYELAGVPENTLSGLPARLMSRFITSA